MSSNTDAPEKGIETHQTSPPSNDSDVKMQGTDENSENSKSKEEEYKNIGIYENNEIPERLFSQTFQPNPINTDNIVNLIRPESDHSQSSSSGPNLQPSPLTASNPYSISADFNNTNQFILNSKAIDQESITLNSRSLQFNDKELLFTGGKSNNSSFTLNIETGHLNTLQDLIIGRSLHAMSWINNSPAVIGGIGNNEETLGSVEIYSDNIWKSFISLNYPRYGHAATFHANKTWVVGGARNSREGEVNIEVLEENQWITIGVQLQACIVGLGLFAIEEEIYVLGGFSISKKNTDEVSALNIVNRTWKKAKNLPEPSCFTQNLWRAQNHTFETFAFRGQKIVYEINT